ncbi:NADPH:quinone oxidoreductase family protein [Streptomyces liangshanensis]|uniref:NADPH:quinone oxidoreductase family protein n=1 Tax=Streptomyces liangshanensis TaxID=2717324 RepID=A0A6G9GSV2_9ACTN|nr:NADPH:quinone oxidoreductase family protein [Streptomyces liangshanensis]QIQ01156.1 NADPH:quinone oxidoreductase family protein [Streptomyces liangshanensis]
MQAWRVHRNGEPREVMRLDEVEPPVPGEGQVLLRVLAANVNFPDALLCRGHYQVRPPLPFTPGIEICGETPDGRRVIATLDPGASSGGFAEYAAVDAAGVLPAPGALDDAETAALHIGYQTGWFALHRRARLQPGETLLVHAAAGGVGSAAVQLGKAAGATVIGVVGGPDKARVARELGCDTVVDRRTEDIAAAVKEATGGRGADVVFDPVGGDAYTASARCVAFEGRIVVVGFAGGEVPAPALNHALVKNYAILGLHWGLYNTKDPAAVLRCHDELTALAARGAIKPLISERVPMKAAADAVQRVADGVTTGRIVVVPGTAQDTAPDAVPEGSTTR